jgi:hypothetical protein
MSALGKHTLSENECEKQPKKTKTEMDVCMTDNNNCSLGEQCTCVDSLSIIDQCEWNPHVKNLKIHEPTMPINLNLPELVKLSITMCSLSCSSTLYNLTKLKLKDCIIDQSTLLIFSRCDFLKTVKLEGILVSDPPKDKIYGDEMEIQCQKNTQRQNTAILNKLVQKNNEITKFVFTKYPNQLRGWQPLIIEESTIKLLQQGCFNLQWLQIKGAHIPRNTDIHRLLQGVGFIKHCVIRENIFI